MDTGGTFTDCLAVGPDAREHRLKVLSSGAVRARVASAPFPDAVELTGLPEVSDGFFEGYAIRPASGGKAARIARWEAATRRATIEGAAFDAGDVVDLSGGEEAPVLAMRILTGTPLGHSLH
ncbi:MAG: hypothetical protein ACREIA_25460, partial [Opitutaceae bacterium]